MTRSDHSSIVAEEEGILAVIGMRTGAIVMLGLVLLAWVMPTLALDTPIAWAMQLVLAATAVAVAPGTLLLAAWRPRPLLTVFEWLALGLGLSLVLVQLITIFVMTVHTSAMVGQQILLLGCVLAAVVAVARRSPAQLALRGDELGLGLGIAVIAGFLYVQGSPVNSTEDHIHISIVRRLASLGNPSIHNVYFSPNIIYTYPYPGTHYLMTLITRVADADAMFAYSKLRVMWGPWALLLLCVLARRFFGNPAVALASAVTALALVANGAFANVTGFFWGQMAPYSHASDIAMGVMLPALLLLAFEYFRATTRSESVLFFVGAIGLVVMLAIVHIREVVQFLVYMGAFAIALLLVGGHSRLWRRVAGLTATSVALMLLYGRWHAAVVGHVSGIVDESKQSLVKVAANASWSDWVSPLLPLLAGFATAFEPMFYLWNPVILFAGPWVIWHFRREPLVLMIAASILVYLLIIRFPLFAIPYIYVTYFEILYTPVRNMIFFIHVMAGALVYLIAVSALRVPGVAAYGVALVGGMLLGGAVRYGGPWLATHPDFLYLTLIPVYLVLAILVLRSYRQQRVNLGPLLPTRRWRLAFVAVLLPVLPLTATVASPLKATASFASPAAMLTGQPCVGRHDVEVLFKPPELAAEKHMVGELLSCPPPLSLVQFAARGIPADAVLAVDKFFEYPASVFLPQQMVVWTGPSVAFRDEDRLFGAYYEQYYKSFRKYRQQPFFNTVETDQERELYLRALGVTHVLLNPRVHAMMTTVLAARPAQYRRLYDEAEWAVYEVSNIP
ncbi:MAG TPA: hypothetical protein VNJ02_04815 [Vicinamibacterales bacterium]|nr:hypothetical protein [Vicinamibacterales bacterium]